MEGGQRRRKEGGTYGEVHTVMCGFSLVGGSKAGSFVEKRTMQRYPDVTGAGVSDSMTGGGLRAVLGVGAWAGIGTILEGLPVDGTCSVFFILALRHPHLFEGVQRRQDGAAAETTGGKLLFIKSDASLPKQGQS